ncbi:CC-NBS-LRR class disease resistance protein [Hibiscus syriacus]|uniref:CC-NBS-LRR class disease resistance protein n=1 Tax=Hibiscus syriacus TaxID=106335 RepID=A0A6A2XFF2_HIBSY|nr:CC-NBS-LRR class disease resistance protein [Hibiscus syriacus]
MAWSAVSSAVKTIGKLLTDEAVYLWGVEKQVDRLLTELKWMQSSLLEADVKQHEDERIRLWVAEIRELAYDAEDVIEDFSLRIGSKKKAGLSGCIERSACILNEGWTLHETRSKIEEIFEKILDLVRRLQVYGVKGLRHGDGSSSSIARRELRKPYPHIIDQSYVDRNDGDIDKLVSKLVEEGTQCKVVSIWGMGGLGKTTLAKKLYDHHSRVTSHFEHRAFVFVSQQFQTRKVWEDILSGLGKFGENDSKLNDEALASKLSDLLKLEKCLVILDDVWSTEDWGRLKPALPVARGIHSNSKILLTSRNKEIVSHADASVYSYELPILNDEESWELFQKIVFPPSDSTVKFCRRYEFVDGGVIIHGGSHKLSETIRRSQIRVGAMAADEGNVKIEKFDEGMKNEDWALLDRQALGVIRLTLSRNVAFNIAKEKTTAGLMAALSRASVAQHLNELNTITTQLSSVEIEFDDEVRALIILSSLPDNWNATVTAVSSSSRNSKLKFDDVRDLVLSEEIRRRESGEASTSSSLHIESRGRTSERNSNRGRSKSKRGKSRTGKKDFTCYNCGKKGHFKRDCQALKKDTCAHESANMTDETGDVMILSVNSLIESWILDSGASFHSTPCREIMENYISGDFGKVHLADDETLKIVGKGDIRLKLPNQTTWTLKGITKEALIIARGKKTGTLYITPNLENIIAVADADGKSNLWHQRLGHMSEKWMKTLLSKGKLPDLKNVDVGLCEDCIFGKQKKVSFAKISKTPKAKKLELVHTDVWGPSPVPSLACSLYYVTFIDDSTRKVNRRFRDFCANNGIKMEKTVPMTPQQNGVAERINRTLNERARSMRIHAGLPKFLWAEAINTAAAYLINCGPSVLLDGRIPEEVWSKKEINLSHLRVFCCISYVHIDSVEKSKLDAKSNKCAFVGYGGDESTVESSSSNTKAETKEFAEFEEISGNNVQISPEVVQEELGTPELRCSSRIPKPTQRYSPSLHYLLLTDNGEPECYDEAIQVEDSVKWESSMKDEMDSLMSNQTWELAELPPGKKALHNKWIYRIKEEHDGSKRYKARLVVKGFQQKEENLHLEQLDVKTAFFHGDLEEEIYMRQPEGFIEAGNKNLFAMKDLGAAKQILGIRIKRDTKSGTLMLSQAKYINKVLSRFNMQDVKPVSTPLGVHFRLSKEQSPNTEEERAHMVKVPYASAIGSLMYAMVCTRPDIAHAVGAVSRYMNNPGKVHWEAVKWILRYLRGTTNKALCFKGGDTIMIGYVDADLAGNVDIRRSTTGYVYTLGGTAVSWVSQLQKIVALSTTEAEYVAVTEASKEMVWLQNKTVDGEIKELRQDKGKRRADDTVDGEIKELGQDKGKRRADDTVDDKKNELGQDRSKQCANDTVDDKKELGKVIVEQCGGLPLAIVVLGGILATKSSLNEWQRVSENIKSYMNRSKGQGQGTREVLALSYDDLPAYLRSCFLYLSHFPEDYVIYVDRLIQLWVAEGIVSSKEEEDGEWGIAEDVAEHYLTELAERCMIQVRSRDVVTSKVETIQMHDLIRDLCLSKAKEENFVFIVDKSNARSLSTIRKVRRVSMHEIFETKYIRCPNLRSLSFFNTRVLNYEGVQSFAKCKLIGDIGNLIHLRFLSLKGLVFKSTKLPSSLGNLRCLQTLDLRINEEDTIHVPDVIWRMEELRHLYLPEECDDKTKLRLDTLRKLLTLVNFNTKKCYVKDLSNMTKIRELKIRGPFKIEDFKEEELDKNPPIIRSKYLHTLTIINREEMIDVRYLTHLLSSCGSICNLTIDAEISKLPEHLSSNLAYIYLSRCKLQEDPIPTLEKLPNLRFLKFHLLSFIGKQMCCSAKCFPKLESLSLYGLKKLEQWKVDKGAMPCLQRFEIRSCRKLEMLPDELRFITTLQELETIKMPKEFHDKVVQGGEDSEYSDEIRDIEYYSRTYKRRYTTNSEVISKSLL